MEDIASVETLREHIHTLANRLSADDLVIAERLLVSLLDETQDDASEEAVFRLAMEAFENGRRKYSNALRELAK